METLGLFTFVLFWYGDWTLSGMPDKLLLCSVPSLRPNLFRLNWASSFSISINHLVSTTIDYDYFNIFYFFFTFFFFETRLLCVVFAILERFCSSGWPRTHKDLPVSVSECTGGATTTGHGMLGCIASTFWALGLIKDVTLLPGSSLVHLNPNSRALHKTIPEDELKTIIIANVDCSLFCKQCKYLF